MTPMEIALAEARAAAERDEVPIGAAVLDAGGAVLNARATRWRRATRRLRTPRLLALRAAAAARSKTRLSDCDLVVTLEPCPMCAQAASFFRVRRLVFGAYNPKGGGVEHGARVFNASSCLWRPEVVGGVREAEAAGLLREFFTSRR